jgi:hypothetical protein
VAGILDKRLVFVTGKGGVGKTTVSAALGLAAARAGKRTMVAEVSEQERVTAVFGKPPAGFSESEIAPGLSAFSVNPSDAREEWLRYQLRSGTLAGLVNSSRIFQYLAAAAPGLAELVTIGKVWELAQLERKAASSAPYDLVIVDAPATGHGLALLRAPRTFAEVARVGPVHRQAGIIGEFIADPAKTGVLAVALAEEMPVNETIELEQRLGAELAMGLDHVVVNGVLPARLTASEAKAIESVDGAGSPAARATLDAALAGRASAQAQRAQVARLRRHVTAPVATLPHLLAPDVEREGLERLADRLERRL